MRMIDWDITSVILEEKLNIPRKILDYISIRDIILLCASGSSNQSIAQFLQTDLEFVCEVVASTFMTEGWKEDLDINPYQILKTIQDYGYIEGVEGTYIPFKEEIQTVTPYYSEEEIVRMFIVSDRYLHIEKEMEIWWQ